ncbi:hypothetical protein [Chryseobacterium viscerum]|uniref:Lipoprotein n=1 Tax=Chryseobacterium viscerum TaxID=1037377 RepID=A0A5N4BVV1_9FLAO|nr:hypothetical protein [Chryseobacterium viscerum]KAB1232556.1 hypothetical protein F8D52_01990 [Chryseobacterium viscerum]
MIKMKYYILIVFLSLLTQNCKSWEKQLSQQGDKDIAIKNAIIDFCNNSTLSHKDKVFTINYKEYNTGVIGVSILGDINKVYIVNGVPKTRIKDQYIEYENKLFYWYDEKKGKNPDIIKKLYEYKVIDSVKILTEDMGFNIDDAKKAAHYYFCKENLLNYQKEENSIAMPKQLSISLNCSK